MRMCDVAFCGRLFRSEHRHLSFVCLFLFVVLVFSLGLHLCLCFFLSTRIDLLYFQEGEGKCGRRRTTREEEAVHSCHWSALNCVLFYGTRSGSGRCLLVSIFLPLFVPCTLFLGYY